MPLGAKEPNKNYTVYEKFNSPSSSLHWYRKQLLYLAIDKLVVCFLLTFSIPNHKIYGGFDI
jgi:hypothetical protein